MQASQKAPRIFIVVLFVVKQTCGGVFLVSSSHFLKLVTSGKEFNLLEKTW